MVVDGAKAAGTQPLCEPLKAKRSHTDQGAKRPGLGLPAFGLANGTAPRRNREPTLIILAGGWHNDDGLETRAARRRRVLAANPGGRARTARRPARATRQLRWRQGAASSGGRAGAARRPAQADYLLLLAHLFYVFFKPCVFLEDDTSYLPETLIDECLCSVGFVSYMLNHRFIYINYCTPNEDLL